MTLDGIKKTNLHTDGSWASVLLKVTVVKRHDSGHLNHADIGKRMVRKTLKPLLKKLRNMVPTCNVNTSETYPESKILQWKYPSRKMLTVKL